MTRISRLLCRTPQTFQPIAAMATLGLALACGLPCPNVAAADQDAGKAAGALDINSCSKPVWPEDALAARRTGTVTLALLIGSDGNVVESKIIKSSGYKDLDLATRAGIAKCKFRPGTTEGKPQQAWMMFKYVWSLD